MPELAKLVNTSLSKGFTVPHVAEKHDCPVGPEDRTGGRTEPMVRFIALEGKSDLEGVPPHPAHLILEKFLRKIFQAVRVGLSRQFKI